LWLVVCALLLVGSTTAAADDGIKDDWHRHQGPVAIQLPRDHGAHPSVRTEWWYLTAILRDGDGQRYGVQITFFRQGIDPSAREGAASLRATDAIAAHMAIAEIGRDRFRNADRLRRAAAGLAGAATDDLNVWVEDWRLHRADDGTLRAHLADRAAGMQLELTFEPRRDLVLHGRDGYSQKGPEPGNASMYVSWTRLAARGQLTLDGRTLDVRGSGWFDHEWGTSQLGEGVVGWDWFSLRLDDGRDLMVYRLRRADGSDDPYSSGTLVAPSGAVRSLDAEDVTLEVLDRWTSPDSGATYPAGWQITVPTADLELTIEPLLSAAELDTGRSTGTVYWEGPVAASGSTTGSGYVELTGYAGSMENVF
jgi:predicted secreted hydrolase